MEDDEEKKFGITKNGKGQKPWTIASRDGFNLLNAHQRLFLFFFFLLFTVLVITGLLTPTLLYNYAIAE